MIECVCIDAALYQRIELGEPGEIIGEKSALYTSVELFSITGRLIADGV